MMHLIHTPEMIEKMNFSQLAEMEAPLFGAYIKARDLFEKMPRNTDEYIAAGKEKNRLYDLHQLVQYWLSQSKKPK